MQLVYPADYVASEHRESKRRQMKASHVQNSLLIVGIETISNSNQVIRSQLPVR